MNKATFKKKFISALRSGEYTQGRGRLRGEGKHCCLGVACEVLGLERTSSAHRGEGYKVPTHSGPSHEHLTLGRSTLRERYLQPNGKYGERHPGELHNRLSDYNDEGFTFDEIADWLEEVL